MKPSTQRGPGQDNESRSLTGPAARSLKAAWYRLVAFGFRLLYDELAWTYDLVSWIVSLGRWREWLYTTQRHLPAEGQVLELGSGPGHLLVALRRAGLAAVGIDISRGMLRLAGRRLRTCHLPPTLCRGSAGHLPLASSSFEAVVVTFPTPFVYDALALREIARVLRPGGRLVIAEQATLGGHGPVHRTVEWLYRITGQRGAPPDLVAGLSQAGFRAERRTVGVRGTTVVLIIADTQGAQYG